MCLTIFYKQKNQKQKTKKIIAFLGYKNNKFK